MLRPVLQYPDPRLAQKAEAVEEITDEIRELAQDLMDTLTTIGGVGNTGSLVWGALAGGSAAAYALGK